MEATKEQKLDNSLSYAYNYIKNVLTCQKRVLSAEDMWSGYSSMGFRPMLTRTVFEDYYYQILLDWKERGILKEKTKGEQ